MLVPLSMFISAMRQAALSREPAYGKGPWILLHQK
jgi:hypothetical protein